MQVDGIPYRSIWLDPDQAKVHVIDQTRLPFCFETRVLTTAEQAADAIHNMIVRGAPLIGATAACGLYLACAQDGSDQALKDRAKALLASRPTAVNLRWAVQRMMPILLAAPTAQREAKARELAQQICDEDVDLNSAIGDHGLELIRSLSEDRLGATVHVLTHCNAGWLATVDWGTALSPIFKAYDAGVDVHVWVDETRPRNQGASLTAWELGAHGIAHTIIADNAGGHLMQQGDVDLCIVGSDRTTRTGDVCNKIGTYLKALAAHDNHVPFYAALPSSTVDWTLRDGLRDIPIEQRPSDEVACISGLDDAGAIQKIRITPASSAAANPAFDVTPRHLVSGIITERGVCEASESGLLRLFPEQNT